MSILINDVDISDPRGFALRICENLKYSLKVDVAPILMATHMLESDRIKKVAEMLAEAAFIRAYDNQWEEFLAPATDDAVCGDFKDDAHHLTLGASSVEIEPNLALTQADADYLKGLTGDDVKKYLFTLTKRFENMAEAKTPGILVLEMISGGVIAVGVPMGVGVVNALRAGMALRGAMLAGVKSIGMKTAVGAVVIMLAALLLYLLLDNPKKILGMVINDSADDLVVKNWSKDSHSHLYMAHGEMVDFMEDGTTLASPRVQIKGRVDFPSSPTDNVIYGGIYFADRNFGFRGSEGVMVFAGQTSGQLIAHQFAVPYVNDNGSNICLLSSAPTDMDQLFRKMYDSRETRINHKDGDYVLTSTVNSARGGVVGCIASITKV